ncbi:DeoR family transcriptional regulator [Burkholderia arboris]|uniref:DeoR family transcriptional regulator n=1 Tax=Burkholderia arboris TaxID=488730 RepID=A0A9Q9SQQ6_9BURK|nr:DeoR family transcriptional regulator [Burkholderia arboris]VWC39777.1 DeoR family transcriptional regulator [Burkholderia arboris]
MDFRALDQADGNEIVCLCVIVSYLGNTFREKTKDFDTYHHFRIMRTMQINWPVHTCITTLLRGALRAFTGVRAERGFPDTLIYVTRALAMMPPGRMALWHSGRQRRTDGVDPRRRIGIAVSRVSNRVAVTGADDRFVIFAAARTHGHARRDRNRTLFAAAVRQSFGPGVRNVRSVVRTAFGISTHKSCLYRCIWRLISAPSFMRCTLEVGRSPLRHDACPVPARVLDINSAFRPAEMSMPDQRVPPSSAVDHAPLLVEARRRLIRELIREREKVAVDELSERFGMSLVTARHGLHALASNNWTC